MTQTACFSYTFTNWNFKVRGWSINMLTDQVFSNLTCFLPCCLPRTNPCLYNWGSVWSSAALNVYYFNNLKTSILILYNSNVKNKQSWGLKDACHWARWREGISYKVNVATSFTGTTMNEKWNHHLQMQTEISWHKHHLRPRLEQSV